MRLVELLLALCLVLVLFESNAAPRTSKGQRDEDQISGVSLNTKNRILAMSAAGVPHDVIADKMAYAVGNLICVC